MVHQKVCDLEGVEGATPPNPNHSFKPMTTTTSTFTPSTFTPSTDVPLALLPVLPLLPMVPTTVDTLLEEFNQTPTDVLLPDNFRPSTSVISAGQTLQELGLNGPGAAVEGAGQIMRSFGFDEDETDPITSGGQTMDTDDDDLGAIFTIGALIGGAIMGAKTAAAAAAAKATAAALAAKVAAGGVVAGAKAVTAGQIGGAIVTGAVSGAASFGVSKAMGADIDSDEGLVQPWMPEVGVDPIA